MASTSRVSVWLSALAIAVFQVAGSFGAADNQPERRAVDAVAVVLALVGPAALAGRDRWPIVAVALSVAAADVYVGLGYPYGPIFVSVVVALYTAVQAGQRRATWLLAAAGFAGFVVATAVDSRAIDDPGALHLALVAGWLVVVLAVSDVVRIRRQQVAEAERAEADERHRQLAEQRLGLAQELHDVLAHDISLINVQASVALHLIDEQPAQASIALAAIKDASHDALVQLRTALDVLRRGENGQHLAAPRRPAPTIADLPDLVDGVRAGGLDVQLDVDLEGAVAPRPAAVELAAYRIVQEALTNVARHARATSATVRVRYADGISVEVTDDGRGSAPAAPAGNGITGMRERATALGGSLEAGPIPGGGFRVAAHLPERRP